MRHIFTGYLTYDLPKFTDKFTRLTQGWRLNTLVTAMSGEPLDVIAGTNISGSLDTRDRVDLVGSVFSNLPANPSQPGRAFWFNPAAFARPAAGTFGNLGRNSFYGPGLASVDFSVFKNTRITERISLQFRAEVFNIFNRTNYANPGVNLNSAATFGLLTNTRNASSAPGLGFGEPRNTQLALKLIW